MIPKLSGGKQTFSWLPKYFLYILLILKDIGISICTKNNNLEENKKHYTH